MKTGNFYITQTIRKIHLNWIHTNTHTHFQDDKKRGLEKLKERPQKSMDRTRNCWWE